MSLQNQWRQCGNCLGLFFTGAVDPGSGEADPGNCPATGGDHVANTGARLLAIRNEARPGAQDGWRRCEKCQGIFYGLSPGGVCPEDHAPHQASEGETYAVGTGAATGAQPGWRWCQKCQGLWFSTSPLGGSCPATGPHDATVSGEYALAFEQDFQGPLSAVALSAASGDTGTRVAVAVSDGAGNAVKGLGAENFRVYRETSPLSITSVSELDSADGAYVLRLSFIPASTWRGSHAILVKVMRDWKHETVAMAPLVHVP